MDSSPRCIEGQLADRDPHPSCALVSDTQNPLVVRCHDHRCLGHCRVAQELFDASPMVGRHIHPTGPPEDLAPVLAGLGNGWCVDDGDDVLEVLDDEPVEQRLVAVLEGRQVDVLLDVGVFEVELFADAHQLLVHR